jgi:hypothetical protein
MAAPAYATPITVRRYSFPALEWGSFYPPGISLANMRRSLHKSGLSAPRADPLLLVVRLLRPHEVQTWPPQSPALTATDGQTADAWRLLAIWFSGFGYIITAIPAAVFIASLAQIDPVQLWALFGLAAVPSCFIWHKLVINWASGGR